MTSPWLSVIMPTYNGEAYLARALDSIASQGEGIEVIALDDGSTDSTSTILNAYAHRLNLRIESRGRIGNWVALSNVGLHLASSDYVCFLHQDDYWLQGRSSTLQSLLVQRPNLILHSTRYIDCNNRFLGLWHCPLPAGRQDPRDVLKRLLVQNFLAIPAAVFSRRTALDIGGLDENLWYAADWDFWLKVVARGPLYYHPRPLTAFRVHGKSQTMQNTADPGEMRRQLEVVLDRYLYGGGSRILNPEKVNRVARFSVELNTALAGAVGGYQQNWLGLARRFLALGPEGCQRFLRDSRIIERMKARVKARW